MGGQQINEYNMADTGCFAWYGQFTKVRGPAFVNVYHNMQDDGDLVGGYISPRSHAYIQVDRLPLFTKYL